VDVISVVNGTSEIHSQTFAQALGAQVTTDPSGQWAFFVGVGPHLWTQVEYCKKKKIKTCAYWIGSDSLCAFNSKEYRSRVPEFDVHIGVHKRMQNELASWGIMSHVVWPCPRSVYQEQVPGEFIGCYQPTPYADNDIYMFHQCVDIANRMPTKKFLFYGAPNYIDLPRNVMDAGRMTPGQVSNLYQEMSCVLRLTQHDGHPVGGIEAKMRGLHVIENYPYEGFLFADNTKSIMMLLEDEATRSIDTSEWPEFYRNVCSPTSFREKVCQILRSQ